MPAYALAVGLRHSLASWLTWKKEEVGQDVDMNRRQLTDAELRQLIKELSALRVRGLPYIDVDTKAKARTPLPLLEELASEFAEGLNLPTRARTIELLLRNAIALIEDEQHRADALTLLLLNKSTESLSPGEARAKVVDRRGLSHAEKRTRFRYEQEIRSVLASRVDDLLKTQTPRKLLASFPSMAGADAGHLTVDTKVTYIHRAALEAELYKALSESRRLIVLYGEGGTGKTQIANQFLRQGQSQNRVLISASEARLSLDLYEALKACGTSAENMSDVALKAEFRHLLAHPTHAPKIVVIDNVEDEQLIHQIVPTAPQSTVLVTARRKLNLDQPLTAIRVGSLTDDESAEMIESRLPLLSEGNKVQLVKALAGRALAIEQVCRFLGQYRDVDPREFCDHLRSSPGEMLQVAGHPEPTLTAIYRSIIKKMDQDDALCVRVLELLSVCHWEDVQFVLVEEYLRESLHLSRTLGGGVAQAVVDRLESHALITRRAHGLSMHPLTHALLREMLDDRLLGCGETALRVFARYGKDQWSPEDSQQRNPLDTILAWKPSDPDFVPLRVHIIVGDISEEYRQGLLAFVAFFVHYLCIARLVAKKVGSGDEHAGRTIELVLHGIVNPSDN